VAASGATEVSVSLLSTQIPVLLVQMGAGYPLARPLEAASLLRRGQGERGSCMKVNRDSESSRQWSVYTRSSRCSSRY